MLHRKTWHFNNETLTNYKYNVPLSYLQQIQRDAEVLVEDEQVFLLKQQTLLNKAPAPGAGGVGIDINLMWNVTEWSHIEITVNAALVTTSIFIIMC